MRRLATGNPNLSPAQQGVRGERGPVIAKALSVQARISNLLAMGLMLAVGVGLLLWYYSHQMARQARARQSVQRGVVRHADTEMTLPPLGPIVPPASGWQGAQPQVMEAGVLATQGQPIPIPALAPVALTAAPMAQPARSADTSPAAAFPQRTTADRRLSGEVFATAITVRTAPDLPVPALSAATAAAEPSAPDVHTGAASSGLSALLQTQRATAVSARMLPNPSMLLPRGAFIDCTLETAIDSALPGLTTCVTATDTFGADGRVVLLERGTKLVGETQGQLQQGAARVFVLWNEARTPAGIVVPLDSPGADELGRSGLSGTVQRHFWERFGAAILISTIDGAVQAAVQSSNHGNGTVIYNPGASQDVMTEALRSTVTITPTITKRNGDRIQVMVARDLDFSSVYELRHAGHDQ